MNSTIQAILARFEGDVPKAVAYCNGIADTADNRELRREYAVLAKQIWFRARMKEIKKRMAAHA